MPAGISKATLVVTPKKLGAGVIFREDKPAFQTSDDVIVTLAVPELLLLLVA